MNLRFNHARNSDFLRRGPGLLWGGSDFTARNRNLVTPQKILRLVFVDIHGKGRPRIDDQIEKMAFIYPAARILSIAWTISLTWLRETWSISFSRAARSISMIFSTPPAPIMTGTQK
jgi:hypothetical protein